MEHRVGRLAERPRFNALLLGIFAAMGLLLAAVGLYGVVSFLVAQRTREIGVRMALGAAPTAITRDVLKRTVRWAAAGAVAGVIGSIFATRLLQGMLYRVSAADPWTFAAALSVLMGVTLVAALIPSRRAARIDPIEALRQE
jgi:ABC-type antimicrobial peptide transport system permease subunit